jgi:Ca2+-binding RTX toxin-like protein
MANVIEGDGNNNVLTGTAGSDYIYAYGGHDYLSGGDGYDALYGDEGDDKLRGGLGEDMLYGGHGVDTADYLDSGTGVTVDLRPGDDGWGHGWYGTANGDRLFSIENVNGSGYDDTLIGNEGANVLIGFDGADALYGGYGSDTLYGGSGDDYLAGGMGGDILDGGIGIDTVGYADALYGVWVDLATGNGYVASDAGDLLYGIENAAGSNFDDTLNGDANANVLNGLAGNDALIGREGDDTLVGGAGDDFLDGGTGADVLSGKGDSDTLSGGLGDDSLEGGAGNDSLGGGEGADKLVGGEGVDTATYHYSSTGVSVDLATGKGSNGDAAGDLLSGIENVTGSNFDDTLIGDANNNVLDGYGNGRDTLTGGLGADDLYAGGGYGVDDVRDTFVYASIGDSGATADTWDQIFQFDRAQSKTDTTSDKIDLRLLDADPDSGDQAFRFVTEFTSPKGKQADGQVRVVDTGSDVNVEIDLNGDNTVDSIIQVMNVDTLTINDFLL